MGMRAGNVRKGLGLAVSALVQVKYREIHTVSQQTAWELAQYWWECQLGYIVL